MISATSGIAHARASVTGNVPASFNVGMIMEMRGSAIPGLQGNLLRRGQSIEFGFV
jgi:hypothetical protein